MLVSHLLEQKGRSVIHAGDDTSLADVVRLLAKRRIGAILIMGADGALAGILSERDIVRALANDGPDALSHSAASHMTRDVTTCSERDHVDDIMEVMTLGRFRHLPVVEDDRVVGLISIGDVVKSRIAETLGEAQALREYIIAAG
jgi:CBS domain-containing protein